MASQKTEEVIEMIANHMHKIDNEKRQAQMKADESTAIAESIIDLRDRELRRKNEHIKQQQYLFELNLCVTIFSVIFGLVCLGYAAWIC